MILNDWSQYLRFFDSVELVVNGEFPNNVGNWVVDPAKGEIYWSNGRLHLKSLASWARATQIVAVEIGETYSFGGDVDSGTNDGYLQLRDSNDSVISDFHQSVNGYQFVATTSSVKIILHASSQSSGECSFDNISLIKES